MLRSHRKVEETSHNPRPELSAGEHVLEFQNVGKQEHELNLVELLPNTTVNDVVDFYSAPPGQGGEPPMIRLGGAIAQPGLTAAARFTVEEGKQYAFICAVPDFTESPPIPHIVKGMLSSAFTVE